MYLDLSIKSKGSNIVNQSLRISENSLQALHQLCYNNLVKTVQFSRKNLSAILAGFVVILLIGIITSAISIFISRQIMVRTLSLDDLRSAFTQPGYLIFSWLLRIISSISPVIGGFVVGRLVKEKGWLYGGILGVFLKLISIGIVSLTFLLPSSLIYGPHLPPHQVQSLTQQNILNQLLYSPITIVLTGLGGYLGEYFRKRNRKNN